jgi:hypothetical protein
MTALGWGRHLRDSSANREYVMDCVEALALPRGMVQHFRYRLKYIDEELESLVPAEGGPLPEALQDLPVVVVYTFQVQTAGKWNPDEKITGGPYIPVRCGRLLRAFKDGEIAHFFFEVTDYIEPKSDRGSARQLLNQIRFKRTSEKDALNSYAHLDDDLKLGAAETADTRCFQTFIDTVYHPNEWRTRSLGSTPLDVTYNIVFYRVPVIVCEVDRKLEPISPVHREIGATISSEYVLHPGSIYHARIATHLGNESAADLLGSENAVLRMAFDPAVIKPIGPLSLRVSSMYDLEYWSFAVLKTEIQRSELRVICEGDRIPGQRHFQRKELLCPEISLPISVVCTTP